MFKRLAQSVLALDEGRRQQLLRDTVLPGLLEGRADGSLLRHFPDLDRADSLSLLLDLQVAAPEMLRSAFERLDLSAERQSRVKPLIDERVTSWSRQERPSDDLKPGEIDGLTEGGLRISADAGTSFTGFAGYEVSFDPATSAGSPRARRGEPALGDGPETAMRGTLRWSRTPRWPGRSSRWRRATRGAERPPRLADDMLGGRFARSRTPRRRSGPKSPSWCAACDLATPEVCVEMAGLRRSLQWREARRFRCVSEGPRWLPRQPRRRARGGRRL
jgi:hypothetical protein